MKCHSNWYQNKAKERKETVENLIGWHNNVRNTCDGSWYIPPKQKIQWFNPLSYFDDLLAFVTDVEIIKYYFTDDNVCRATKW